MIEMLTDYLIRRRLKKDYIPVEQNANTPRDYFKRVLNTLRKNKVMVDTRPDGIYIRMAGSVERGEAFSLDWVRVIKFKSGYSYKTVYVVEYLYMPSVGSSIYKFANTFDKLEDAQECKKNLENKGFSSRIIFKQNNI